MSGEPSLDALLARARATQKQGDQYVSHVFYVARKGTQIQAHFQNASNGEMVPALIGLLDMLQMGFGAPAWIGYTTDAYAFTGEWDDRPDNLAEAFANGDMRVYEELYALVVGLDGTFKAACQKFRWTPVDGWEWDEPTDHDPSRDGVTTTLQMFLAKRV